jgi:hypothetical protein
MAVSLSTTLTVFLLNLSSILSQSTSNTSPTATSRYYSSTTYSISSATITITSPLSTRATSASAYSSSVLTSSFRQTTNLNSTTTIQTTLSIASTQTNTRTIATASSPLNGSTVEAYSTLVPQNTSSSANSSIINDVTTSSTISDNLTTPYSNTTLAGLSYLSTLGTELSTWPKTTQTPITSCTQGCCLINCLNGATCRLSMLGNPYCICQSNYTGFHCQICKRTAHKNVLRF